VPSKHTRFWVLMCTTVSLAAGCSAAKPVTRESSTTSGRYYPMAGTAPHSLGMATLSGSIEGRVRASLGAEASCILAGQVTPTRARQAIWEQTSRQLTTSAVTHWITVSWTTADFGETVALSPDPSADPPRVGVQLSNAGASDQQWVSTSGQLSILPNGSGGSCAPFCHRTTAQELGSGSALEPVR